MGRTKSDRWLDFYRAYRQHIESSTARGLKARWLVRSKTEPSTFFTISLWDTLTAMESYERSDAVRRQVLQHIAPHLEGISTAHHCEVRRDLPLSTADIAALLEPLR
jgi:heme-degrading monooxygenase HmoA